MLKYLLLSSVFFLSCESKEKKETPSEVKSITTKTKGEKPTSANSPDTDYALLKSNCMSCHLEKMGPGQKIAPPMVRVQEHYKPLYPKRADFITAVSDWVTNPDESKSNMPGAVRKFNLMPKLGIEKGTLTRIAGALFDAEFQKRGAMGGKKDHAGLQLAEGKKKWKLNVSTMDQVKKMHSRLKGFSSDDVKAYSALGKEVFDGTKTIILDKQYKGKTFDQLHAFFNSIEKDMHTLIGATDLELAKKQVAKLVEKFSKFGNFFES